MGLAGSSGRAGDRKKGPVEAAQGMVWDGGAVPRDGGVVVSFFRACPNGSHGTNARDVSLSNHYL